VLDQLADDPSGRHGPRVVKELIANKTGVMLPRLVHSTCCRCCWAARDLCTANTSETRWCCKNPKVSWLANLPARSCLGSPWLCLAHTMSGVVMVMISLLKSAFQFGEFVWLGKWLGIWVLPNNRLKDGIAYLYLSLCYQLGGLLYCHSQIYVLLAHCHIWRHANTDDNWLW